jgi:hypothetical protein
MSGRLRVMVMVCCLCWTSYAALAQSAGSLAQEGNAPESVSPSCLKLEGQWPSGIGRAVATAGKFAYFGSGSLLEVADISAPAVPVVVGTVNLPNLPEEIAVSGDRLYIADGLAGLQVVSVADPTHPVITGTLDFGESCSAVRVGGSHAFLESWMHLRVVDISSPDHPLEIGNLEIPGGRSLCLSGPFVYVGSTNYLSVVDVTIPSHPILRGRLSGGADGLATSGSKVYGVSEGYLEVIDVSNPDAPVWKGGVSLGYSYSLFLHRIALSGTTGWIAYSYAGLVAVDLSNEDAPVILSQMPAKGRTDGVAVAGNTVVLADTTGLSLVDGTVPASPHETGWIQGFGGGYSVGVSGTIACVGTANLGWNYFQDATLRIFDISDPASLILQGSITLPARPARVAVTGNTAVVADDSAGFRFIDISDRTNPVEIASLPTNAHAWDIALQGGYAYLADWWTLRFVDIRDPAHPRVASALGATTSIQRIYLDGSTLYYLDSATLAAVDVSNPESPRTLWSKSLSFTYPSTLAVSAGSAYLLRSDGTLVVYDVSDPSNIRMLSYSSVPRSPSDILLKGTTAYIASEGSGITALDVSQPSQPRTIGQLITWGGPASLAATASTLLLADYDLGLFTLDVSGCGTSCTLASDPQVLPRNGGVTPVQASFLAQTTASTCGGSPVYSWDFGDGMTSSEENPVHAFSRPGYYRWKCTASAGGQTAVGQGILPVLAVPPTLSTVKKPAGSFQLKITGKGFQRGLMVTISDKLWSRVKWVSKKQIVLTGGQDLEKLFPPGQSVEIAVINPDGGLATIPYAHP